MDNNGIMYPITIPQNEWPRDDNGNLLVTQIECYGAFNRGDGDCVSGGDRFLRLNESPDSLVPPNWIADTQGTAEWFNGWRYFCPRCVATIEIENRFMIENGVDEDEIESIGNEGQSSNESGTGRSIHGNPQPPQETHGMYLGRLESEASRDANRQLDEFRRQQGRFPNGPEMEWIFRSSGYLKRSMEAQREISRIKKILTKLNISFPDSPDYGDENSLGEYIKRLHNLIPPEYFKKKEIKETPDALRAEAKELFDTEKNPKLAEHLSLVLEQIDKDERKKKTHAATLREMDGKYYSDDDNNNDGASSSPRKKSKKNTEFKGPEGKFSLGKKTKKKKRRTKKNQKKEKKNQKKEKKNA